MHKPGHKYKSGQCKKIKEDVKMKLIGALRGLEEVNAFLSKISEAFGNEMVMKMTGWMTPAHFRYYIDIRLAEGESCCVANHHLTMNTHLQDEMICGRFCYCWITSREHALIIESISDCQVIYKRDWNEEKEGFCQPWYNVYIGEENSRRFYPTVIETLQKILEDNSRV